MTINTNCCVCNEESNKYKCPTCGSIYCSLSCSKKHKEIPCEPKIINTEPENQFVEDRVPPKMHLFTTVDTVKIEKLEELSK